MKKSLLFITICIGLAIFFYPMTSNSNATGSPGGKTDSPMDGQNCTGCHGGPSNLNSGIGTAAITTNIPTSGYTIGNTYTIKLTGTRDQCIKFGFELTAENGINKTGTFFITNSTETKFANGTSNTAVTHKTAGTIGNTTTKNWSMDWTPTINSSGSTTFYAALMFANGDGDNGPEDKVFTTSLDVNEEIVSAINDLSVRNNFTFNTASKTIETQKTVEVYDISGKLVLTTTNNSTNVSQLKTGIYILKSSEKTQKIILN
jgi:hypothetical protein